MQIKGMSHGQLVPISPTSWKDAHVDGGNGTLHYSPLKNDCVAGGPPAGVIHTMRLPKGSGHGEGRLLSLGVVGSRAHHDAAASLITRRYQWRGYGGQHRPPVGPLSMTFTASVDDAIAGTITLTVDSGHGLAADETFRDVLNTYRRVDGARICEMTKLAVDDTVSSKPLLAALFHVVFILGSRFHDCTDLFIEVNPRHRRFYRVMLGFEPIGDLRMNMSVNAPSQLMRLEVSRIQNFIDECRAEASDAAGRSLYPDFLSPGEQDKVVRVLANGSAGRAAAPKRARLPAVRFTGIRKRLAELRAH